MLDEERKTLSHVRLEKAKKSVIKAEEFVKTIEEYLNRIE